MLFVLRFFLILNTIRAKPFLLLRRCNRKSNASEMKPLKNTLFKKVRIYVVTSGFSHSIIGTPYVCCWQEQYTLLSSIGLFWNEIIFSFLIVIEVSSRVFFCFFIGVSCLSVLCPVFLSTNIHLFFMYFYLNLKSHWNLVEILPLLLFLRYSFL